jgi:hypothetical protein
MEIVRSLVRDFFHNNLAGISNWTKDFGFLKYHFTYFNGVTLY